jgi:hypothetical protein
MMLVRATVHKDGLRPGRQYLVDPDAWWLPEFLRAGFLVPVVEDPEVAAAVEEIEVEAVEDTAEPGSPETPSEEPEPVHQGDGLTETPEAVLEPPAASEE